MFTKENLPGDPEDWPGYKKRTVVRAVRIDGPFTVLTHNGPLTCPDGYLALDARGWPYPIDVPDFGVYEMVEPPKKEDALPRDED